MTDTAISETPLYDAMVAEHGDPHRHLMDTAARAGDEPPDDAPGEPVPAPADDPTVDPPAKAARTKTRGPGAARPGRAA